MGQKDITEKVLEDYNDVFADIINGLLFDGVQEIKPEALENTTVHTQYKAEDHKVHELERDIAKYWKEEKVELAICGIVNLMKSYTTYHIWKRYPQYLRKQFWKEHTFWRDGYFACSVGNVSEEMLKRYIGNHG